jgi:hypothetical protein
MCAAATTIPATNAAMQENSTMSMMSSVLKARTPQCHVVGSSIAGHVNKPANWPKRSGSTHPLVT